MFRVGFGPLIDTYETIVVEEPHHLAYKLMKGLPIRGFAPMSNLPKTRRRYRHQVVREMGSQPSSCGILASHSAPRRHTGRQGAREGLVIGNSRFATLR